MPTNGGKMEDFPMLNPCEETKRYERNTGKRTITVEDGLKVSSNYVFRRLVADNYLNCPDEFIDKFYEYHLHDAYTFDLSEKGGTLPELPVPDAKMGKYDLVSAAIGYNVKETPLNIVTFYNAIANNGKMMKPYLVESHEKNGKTVKKFDPEILNGSVCSKATADSLTRALTMVTLEGTAATKLRNAKCVVAGKTGTARVVLNKEDKPKKGDPYVSVDGLRRYQATFVGFFPAETPKYTAIVVLYSGLRQTAIGGGNLPALTYKEIVDNIWSMDSSWGETYIERADVPEMKTRHIATASGSNIPVPDLREMGLSDAMYAAENNGYRLEYEGIGHVVSQTPAAGKEYKKGETIKVVLK
jgi:cell division protein FtsI (penicillin-binding protein 3)